MKLLSRDFTTKEKVLLLLLVLILVALVYYQFVYRPVADGIVKADDQKKNLEIELEAVNTRVSKLQQMQNEVDGITENGTLRSMPSYNNSKNVNRLLNDVLGDMGYSIVFSNVERSGDQVRRNVQLQYVAPNYESAKEVFSQLTSSEYRCLIGDIRLSSKEGSLDSGEVTVVANLTFYETMVGGQADAGLPVEEDDTIE